MKKPNTRVACFILCLTVAANMLASKKEDKFDMMSYVDGNKRATLLEAELEDDLKSIKKLGLDNSLDLSDSLIDGVIKNCSGGECEQEFDVTADEVISQIKKNTSDYLAKHSSMDMISFFDEQYFYDNEFIIKDGVVLTEDIIRYMKDYTYNAFLGQVNYILKYGTNGDIHNLMELKIVFDDLHSDKSGTIFGTYNAGDNLIKISIPNIIASYNSVYKMQSKISSVIRHELNHMCQYSCNDVIRNNKIVKLNFLTDSPFLIEASAESALYNLNMLPINETVNVEFTYKDYRKQESALLLCSLFNQYPIEEYYQAINSQDMNAFFNFLGAETDEEKRELYRVIYAFDSIDKRNSYIVNVVGNKDTYTKEDYLKMTDKLKNLQYITIFRITINNLINYNIKHSDLTLDDNILLYKLVAEIISEGAFRQFNSKNEEEIYYTYDEFIEEYKIIENSFFAALQTIYKVSDEEINSLYEEYNNLPVTGAYKNMIYGSSVVYNINGKLYPLTDSLNKLIKKFPKVKEVLGNTYAYTDIGSKGNLRMLENTAEGKIFVKKLAK